MRHPKKFEVPGLFEGIMKAYQFPQANKTVLNVIASIDQGHYASWEHVSVHGVDADGKQYTPSWDEMCFVKDIFFEEQDVVIQIHPKKRDYVNLHQHCLHLWRSLDGSLNLPTFSE
jgi:hypothetical protein